MFILQRLPPPVNVQISYIFQLFFERSAKNPGERVLLGGGVQALRNCAYSLTIKRISV